MVIEEEGGSTKDKAKWPFLLHGLLALHFDFSGRFNRMVSTLFFSLGVLLCCVCVFLDFYFLIYFILLKEEKEKE